MRLFKAIVISIGLISGNFIFQFGVAEVSNYAEAANYSLFNMVGLWTYYILERIDYD